ncbi:MAG: hypothetical protein JWN15_847, partial [Firmicutes bacterium]|nr:hypothetical protein [Bacillota bacterium]
ADAELLSAATSSKLWRLLAEAGVKLAFPPGARHEVTVSYLHLAAVEGDDPDRPFLRSEYLLSPAKAWAGFGTLDVHRSGNIAADRFPDAAGKGRLRGQAIAVATAVSVIASFIAAARPIPTVKPPEA